MKSACAALPLFPNATSPQWITLGWRFPASSMDLLPAVVYSILQHPYQKARVMSFIDPWKDPLGNGFQVIQSFLALGRVGSFMSNGSGGYDRPERKNGRSTSSGAHPEDPGPIRGAH